MKNKRQIEKVSNWMLRVGRLDSEIWDRSGSNLKDRGASGTLIWSRGRTGLIYPSFCFEGLDSQIWGLVGGNIRVNYWG